MNLAPQDLDRLRTYLTLLAVPGIGRVGLGRGFDGAPDWAWLDQGAEALLGPITGSLFPDFDALKGAGRRAQEQLERCRDLGIRPLMQGREGYPEGLNRLADPPRVLYVQGIPPPAGSVAVVGTRQPSEAGLAQARLCAEGLARAGLPLLNGLARGVDAAAVAAGLGAGGVCVGVLAAGHDSVGQAGSMELAAGILRQGGSVVSEYAPGTLAHKGSFIERDRVQAGLSASVLVVEAHVDGGTMHTARAAAEAGVPLFALFPTSELEQARRDPAKLAPTLQGPWRLIRSGAAVEVRNAAEWLERLKA
jgi:DNA processing protein